MFKHFATVKAQYSLNKGVFMCTNFCWINSNRMNYQRMWVHATF